MPYCNNCEKKIEDTTNFCSNCGTAFSPMKKTEKNTVNTKDAPSDVLSYLTTDENLLQTEKSDEWEIYVTDKRVIFKKGGIFVAGIVIAILLSSVISFSLSMHFAVGPQGETGLQGPIG